MARSGPISRRSIPGKVKVFPVYSTNEQGEPYMYNIVDRNPLVSNYYYGLLRTLLQLVVPNTDIHKKRGIRTDIRTPSLDDGGLVHFSGPRLIG